MSYLMLLGGLVLLAIGGEGLVRGAVALADRLSISPVFVGLTVVAIGTSIPELAVAIDAAMSGTPDIAVGSVIGSNISNILLVLAVTALIRPIACEARLVFRDGLFLLAVSFAIAMVALTGSITMEQGGLMLLLLVLFLGYSYWAEVIHKAPSAKRRLEEVEEYQGVPDTFWAGIPSIALGLVAVIVGADYLVEGAVQIARSLGVAEAIIGLSLVAVGTSVPELAVSALAAMRGHAGVAAGNVIGSNISNLLLILGTTSLLGAVPVADQIARFDVWVMMAATIVMVPVMISGRKINRREGFFFLAAYCLYVGSLYAGVPQMVISVIYA